VNQGSGAGVDWYFEDFHPGQEIDLGTRKVSEDEIVAFASQFDPQPFHVDHHAHHHRAGGLMAKSSSMGSPGLDGVRWLAPVRAGDTLHVRYQTVQVKPSSSKPDRGVVWSKWVASNQHGETVCTVEGMGMFARRPPADGAG
jgi:acyl dehydratase